MSTNSDQSNDIRPYVKRNCPFKSNDPRYRRWLYINCYRDKKPWIESYKRRKGGALTK